MKTNIKVSTIIKTNISSAIIRPEDIDYMDVKALLETIARIGNLYNSLISINYKSEEHIKYSEERKQLSASLTKLLQSLSNNNNKLVMENNQCSLKTIHDVWAYQTYYSKKVANMKNEIQFNQLKKCLPEYAPLFMNIKKTDLFLWTIDQTKVPFYYFGTYGSLHGVLSKFLKYVLK
jgi:hypothetical protein